MNTLFNLLAQVQPLIEEPITRVPRIGDSAAGDIFTVVVMTITAALIILSILLPVFVCLIHGHIKKQTILIKTLVDNSVIISAQLSRLPQAPQAAPPGARR